MFRQLVSMAALVLLMRWLDPVAFGIFAMTTFVTELGQMMTNFGLGSAIVQQKQIEPRTLASCFWLNLGVGMLAAVILLVVSPWVAQYYKESHLVGLLAISALGLLVSAMTVVPQSLLTRQLDFKQVSIANSLGSIAGSVAAVAAAGLGAGVMALALQPLVGAVVVLVYLARCARWRPIWAFDWPAVRSLVVFSGHLLTSQVMALATRNVQPIVLGPTLGAGALGLLSVGQTLTWLPIAQFSQIIVRTTFPVLAKLRGDMRQLHSALYRSVHVIGFFAFPLLIGIGLLAKPLVAVLFGPQWRESVPLVHLMCIATLAQSVGTLSSSVLVAMGRTRLIVWLSVINLVAMLAAMGLVRHTDIYVASVAFVAVSVAGQLMSWLLMMQSVNGSYRAYGGPLLRSLSCCALMSAAILGIESVVPALQGMSPWVGLIGLSLVGAVVYLSSSWWLNNQVFRDILTVAFKRAPR